MSKTDLQSDLLADLQGASYAGPSPVAVLRPRGTPTFDLRVTPLRWSRVRVSAGTGVSLFAGPVQLRVSR